MGRQLQLESGSYSETTVRPRMSIHIRISLHGALFEGSILAHDIRYSLLLPLTGDKKAKSCTIFAMIGKKLLLANKFRLQKKPFGKFKV